MPTGCSLPCGCASDDSSSRNALAPSQPCASPCCNSGWKNWSPNHCAPAGKAGSARRSRPKPRRICVRPPSMRRAPCGRGGRSRCWWSKVLSGAPSPAPSAASSPSSRWRKFPNPCHCRWCRRRNREVVMAADVCADTPSLTALYGGWIKRTALMLKSRMPWAELDELLQWGAIGMLESMNRFDRTLGISFEAFASRRIRGAMIDGLRRDGALRRGESILEPDAVDTAALAGGTSPDDPLALLLRADAKTLLVEALRSLPMLE